MYCVMISFKSVSFMYIRILEMRHMTVATGASEQRSGISAVESVNTSGDRFTSSYSTSRQLRVTDTA